MNVPLLLFTFSLFTFFPINRDFIYKGNVLILRANKSEEWKIVF